MSPKVLKVIFAAGGTGGHIFPAFALAETLKSTIDSNIRFDTLNILFIGSDYGLETRLVPEANYALEMLPIRGIARSLSIKNIIRNLQFPFRVLISILKMNRILQDFKPDLVIGTGGYASGIPVRQAIKKGIPVFLQEQNSYPGLTTRMFSDAATHVYITYDDARKHLNTHHISNFGNPVRSNLVRRPPMEVYSKFALNPKRKTLFIFGGSQGAHAINQFLITYIREFAYQINFQILWQTGEKDFEACNKAASQSLNISVVPFIKDMGAAFSMATLVISRAGAMALAEIISFGLPSILIPLPSATANHQYHNAKTLENEGAAIIIEESKLEFDPLLELFQDLFSHEEKLKLMSQNTFQLAKPHASQDIINSILEHIN
jgi:UDP-N-acetylglucosamine--N-acetylmuramyl-(pentapeptide) pyrophosphoryl-undecaprenol N-acetylglucosamine transferase